ncbi:hypothetical protein JTE90_024077 [Oedothorax gibbosus]|uniref:Uncharacterized protein n=1 Tax=Oedothorax gibbosus TaxID=931172 RepID=A0AAV6U851_9ARAC|nr:hypothetical protein JTE90_024077 [Oedothorax gibbosus]
MASLTKTIGIQHRISAHEQTVKNGPILEVLPFQQTAIRVLIENDFSRVTGLVRLACFNPTMISGVPPVTPLVASIRQCRTGDINPRHLADWKEI